MFESIILPAMGLGVSAFSTPGPFQAYLLNVTLNHGWKRGLLVILSPLIVDGPIILLTVFILRAIDPQVIQGIRVAGGLLLLWIAWGAWQQLRKGVEFKLEESPKAESSHPREILLTAMAMNVLSPGPYLFWSTVNGPLLLKALEISPLAALGMLVGFYSVFLGGMVLMVLAFYRLGKLSQDVTRYLLIATIALLLWFGTRLILVDVFALELIHQGITVLIILSLVIYSLKAWNDKRIMSQA